MLFVEEGFSDLQSMSWIGYIWIAIKVFHKSEFIQPKFFFPQKLLP